MDQATSFIVKVSFIMGGSLVLLGILQLTSKRYLNWKIKILKNMGFSKISVNSKSLKVNKFGGWSLIFFGSVLILGGLLPILFS